MVISKITSSNSLSRNITFGKKNEFTVPGFKLVKENNPPIEEKAIYTRTNDGCPCRIFTKESIPYLNEQLEIYDGYLNNPDVGETQKPYIKMQRDAINNILKVVEEYGYFCS